MSAPVEKGGAYRCVVVGCGARSRPHIEASRRLPDVDVVACCAPGATRRDELAAEYGIRGYGDVGEMLAAEEPHLVHLVTWPDTRVELMSLVAERGVPLCTVEKPIASGVADWRALCELEAAAETRFAVCHQMRWQKHLVACREALATGELGEVKFLDISAGMNISGQGTHILNYGMSLIEDSPVVRVFGAASGIGGMDGGHPAPDSTSAYLTFANGVRGLWTNGPTAMRCGDPVTEWQHVRAAAHADRGRVNYEEFGRWEIVSKTRETEAGDFGGLDAWRANNAEAQTAFHRAMIDWLEKGEVPGTNLRQSLHEWQVVLALYASALERRPVDVEAGFEPIDDLFDALKRSL